MRICLSSLIGLIATVAALTTQSRSPITAVRQVEDATVYSRSRTLRYDSNLEIAFTTADGPIQLELNPNFDLLHVSTPTFRFEDDFGDLITEEDVDPTAFMVYKGHALQSNGYNSIYVGYARIMIHNQNPLTFDGSFSVNGIIHHIQLRQDYNRLKTPDDVEIGILGSPTSMVLWSEKDFSHRIAKRDGGNIIRYENDGETGTQCRADDFMYNADVQGITPNQDALFKRQSLTGGDTGSSYVTQAQLARTIGSTAGCPQQREVAVIGAAADCNFVQLFNSTQSARANIISAFNQASGLYESSFNISLGLGRILVSEADCPSSSNSASPWNTACNTATTIGDRLNEFSTWRGSQTDTFAAWSLLTTCATDAEIGVAWLGTLCNANTTNQTAGSVVSGTNVVAALGSGGSYWKTLAHEVRDAFH